ncbi:hypothetical protein N2152v2_004780 [Parachlorella kessleri]
MTSGSHTISKHTAAWKPSPRSKLLAQTSSGILRVGKVFRKKKSSTGKLGQGATPVQPQPQQAASDTCGAPASFIPNIKLPMNAGLASPQKAAADEPVHRFMVTIAALKASAGTAPAAQETSCAGSSDGSDSDSQPDSPTGVLHWLRPSRTKHVSENALALTLRYEQLLAAERAARLAAEATAAAKAEEVGQLQEEAYGMESSLTGMQQVIEGLRAKADRLQAQLSALQEVGDKDLKQSFCELQSAYGAAQAKLDGANYTICRLRLRLKAGQGSHRLFSVLE